MANLRDPVSKPLSGRSLLQDQVEDFVKEVPSGVSKPLSGRSLLQAVEKAQLPTLKLLSPNR